MYRFIIIESNHIAEIKEQVIELMSDFLTVDKYRLTKTRMIIEYSDYSELSFYDVAQSMSADLYVLVRIYESPVYQDTQSRDEMILYVQTLLDKIALNKYFYLSNVEILKETYFKQTKELKRLVLNKYADDLEMQKTIKVFLENNQNVTLAAQALYLHRNTLMQRIEKFMVATMFDPKKFIDGFLIYHVL